MKSPEKPEYGSDDNQDEFNKKLLFSNRTDKKKKTGKVLIKLEPQTPQPIPIPFEEQETIDFILMDFKNPKELENFKNMKHLTLIQQNISSIKVIKFSCYTQIIKN